jgi:diaminopimelate epimerase
MDGRPFIKMHGIGNDFVVVDARQRPFAVDAAAARAIADRRKGVGFDQLIVIEPSAQADVFMRIRNSDGGEVEACGNGARCVASLLLSEGGRDAVTIETLAGILPARRAAGAWYAVGMGVPRFGWQEVPLARAMDTLHVELAIGPASKPVLSDPVALSMGNPHAVFFVADVALVDIVTVGPMLEHHPLFPERANIGVAQVLAPDRIRLRVWERGAGLTQACGSGACAAAVAAMRRGLTRRQVRMMMDGGELEVTWREADGMVEMSGPVATSFTGVLAPELLATRADRAA